MKTILAIFISIFLAFPTAPKATRAQVFSDAQWNMARRYEEEARKDDCAAMLALIREAREGGDWAVLLDEGELLETGRCVAKNPAKAAELYYDAIDHEIDFAYYRLGYLFDNGLGVERSPAKARELYKLGVLGHVYIDNALRKKFAEKIIGERPFPSALSEEIAWLDRVEKSAPLDTLAVAVKLRDGEGLPKHRKGAIALMSKLATKDVREAWYEFGMTLREDPDPEKRSEGLNNIMMAAMEGYRPAQEAYGRYRLEKFNAGHDAWDAIQAYGMLYKAGREGADVDAELESIWQRLSEGDREQARYQAGLR